MKMLYNAKENSFTDNLMLFFKHLLALDLMLPGVIFKGEPHPKMFGSLKKGDLCIISLKGNK